MYKKKKVVKRRPSKKGTRPKRTFTGSKKCTYTSKIAGKVKLDSTWELAYAKYLDKNKIEWKRNLIKFPYYFEKKLCYYIPDFFLIKEDIYIEVKGFETDRDKAKWRDFPYQHKVLRKEDLLELGLKIK